MIDDPLPSPSGIDAESRPSDERPGDQRPNDDQSHDDRPDREPATGPDRITDPPPDRGEGTDAGDGDAEPEAGGDDTEESEPLEYRLERLRLVRTVVTLAVVVARLIRSV